MTGCGPARRLFFGVSGPSGVGKGTVVEAVLARVPELRRVRMVTDRPRRATERAGEQFDYVTTADLERVRRAGRLATLHATYGLSSYGVEHAATDVVGEGEAGILELDLHNLTQFSAHYPTVGILLLAPSFEENRRRLEQRGAHSPEEVHRRLASAAPLLRAAESYDHVCVNHRVEETVALVAAIVVVELARIGRDRAVGVAQAQLAALSSLPAASSPLPTGGSG